MRKLSLVLFCTAALLFQACQKYEDFREIDRVSYTPELAVPLVYSSLSLDEILESEGASSYLTIAEDGSMSLDYNQEEVSKEASELIDPIQDFQFILADSFMSVPVQIFDKLSVTALSLKNGSLSFDIQSSHTEDINLKIIIPGMTQNGTPFEVQTALNYQGSTPVAASIPAEAIKDFTLNMPDGLLDIRYVAYNTSGTRVKLDMITGEARDWEYDHIEGVWSNETFTIDQDTIDIDVFENWVDGEVNFEDPKLKINLRNSIGFPMQMRIQNMVAYTADGTSIPFSSMLDDGYNISYPALTEIGQEQSDIITLDKSNSNIVSVLNNRPKYITYEVIAVINPEDENVVGFVSDQSKLTGDVTMELPIYGTAAGFTLETISDFDIEEVNKIEQAEFKIITNNAIPLDLQMQIYFTDADEKVIDSMFQAQRIFLAAPETGANGDVLAASEQSNIVTVGTEKMAIIQEVKKVKINATVSTANEASSPVRILSTQKVEVKMGAKLKLNGE